jgi:LPXTG-motif cell wall-anchored protein
MPGFREGSFQRDVVIVADTDTILDVIAPPSVPWYLPSSTPPVRPAPAPGLPITGAQVGLIAGAGGALLVAGALLLVLGRRRRSATEG